MLKFVKGVTYKGLNPQGEIIGLFTVTQKSRWYLVAEEAYTKKPLRFKINRECDTAILDGLTGEEKFKNAIILFTEYQVINKTHNPVGLIAPWGRVICVPYVIIWLKS